MTTSCNLREIVTLALLAAVILFTGCPTPVPSDLAGQINDVDGPVITITEPVDRSQYSTVVRVSGTVSDAEEGDSVAQVAACACAVPGTSAEGSFSIEADGTFTFLFATRDADGTTLVDGPATTDLTARE